MTFSCHTFRVTAARPELATLVGRSHEPADPYRAREIGISACLNEHTVSYARMDDLARRLVITRSDGIAHQQLLNELSDVDLLIIDDLCEASH